ncbi:MAG: S8 family peptidase, partial [Planctomycetota bacterium]
MRCNASQRLMLLLGILCFTCAITAQGFSSETQQTPSGKMRAGAADPSVNQAASLFQVVRSPREDGANQGGAVAGGVPESEPNNTIGDAQETPLSAGTLGHWAINGSISPAQDVDYFQFDAEKGAIYGFNALGGGSPDTILSIHDSEGLQVVANDDHSDIADLFPPGSPFSGGQNVLDSALTWTAPQSGEYFVRVASFQGGSTGDYEINMVARHPAFEGKLADRKQVFVLDFDGAELSPADLFDSDVASATLTPFVSFMSGWFDEFDDSNPPSDAERDQLIDAIVAVVRENLDDLRLGSLNGDRDLDDLLGTFQYELVVVRDSSDTDLFGGPNVSRVVVGGTRAELGIEAIAVSESIDPGNFDAEETAVVTLDLYSGPASDPFSINSLVLDSGASKSDAVSEVVGNTVARTIGWMVGNFNTDGDNAVVSVMDIGGTGSVGVSFDGVAPGPVDQTPLGDATLDYEPDTTEDATIGLGIFQASALIHPPYVEGSTGGVLTIEFAEPVIGVGYRFAVKDSGDPGAVLGPDEGVSTIQLLNASDVVIATASGGVTVSQFGISEGANVAFTSDGTAQVASVRISFDGSDLGADTFAVDGLTFFVTPSFLARSLAGVGPDNIFGTVDDQDPDFLSDNYLPAETLGTGIQNVDVRTAFGLSSGTEPIRVCTTIFFDENFESAVVFEDIEDFTRNNNIGAGNGQWDLTNACDSLLEGHSLDNSLYFGVDDGGEATCTYDVGNSDGWVTVQIGAVDGEADISFNYFLETEGDLDDFDIARFEVAKDGSNFDLMATNKLGSAPVTLNDPSGGWQNLIFDQICQDGECPDLVLRWQFTTGDSGDNRFRGFYIDDVKVCEHSPCQPVSPDNPSPDNAAEDQPVEDLLLSWNGLPPGDISFAKITFDEVAVGTILDQTIINNVQFEFTSSEATVVDGEEFFDSGFLSPPFVSGPATGVITMNFLTPVNRVGVSFGFPEGAVVQNAATLSLFDKAGNLLTSESADLAKSQFTITEGEIFTDSDVPVGKATLTFDHPSATTFFFDNVEYDQATADSPTATASADVLRSIQIPKAKHKISGEILLNKGKKERLIAAKPDATREDMLAAGLGGKSFQNEECALYVHRKLNAGECEELRQQGVDINEWAWIPPVTGLHTFGYYLARVDYDSLNLVQNDQRIVKLLSVEGMAQPRNDLGAVMIGADDVKSGLVDQVMRTGAGVRVAVADSGLDVDHPDLPTPIETFDVTFGDTPIDWPTDVANFITSHGTHVTGTVVGSGLLSNGKYAGAAPGADLYFYKIGNDNDATATFGDMVKAINRASEVGCDIFNMSYGGISSFLDGSDP